MAALDVTQKAAIYHTLYELNSSFAAIVGHCSALQQAGVLTPKYSRLFQGFAQELQAELNSELLQFMDQIELDDWSRFGRIRDQWEKYLRGADPKQRKRR